MPTYTHTTLGAFKSALAARLGDAGMVHWVSGELTLYAYEALHVWNAFTGSNRTVVSISTTEGQPFYSTPLIQTARDRDLIGLIQYQLMEPYSPGVWTGTDMFTLAEVTAAIQRRRDQFLADTECTLTQQSYAVTAGSETVELTEETIAVRRAVWVTPEGHHYSLFPSDDDVATGTSPSWLQSPGIPSSYGIATDPNTILRFYPPPNDIGTLELFVVTSGTPLDPTANSNVGTLLGIPDDFAFGVRFGALSDLLRKDGPARDLARATFCESFYSLAVGLCRNFPVVLTTRVNNVFVYPTTLTMLDTANFGWQGKEEGRPQRIGIAGDVIATLPVPDGDYSLTIEYVDSATPLLPATDDDFIQVAREDVEGVLAWAQMLATFKSAGASLELGQTAAEHLDRRAELYNERRNLSSTYLRQLLDYSTDDRRVFPQFSSRSTSSSSESDGADQTDNASMPQSRARSNAVRRNKRLGGR